MIRRPPRSTLSSSSAASDVYKRQYQRRVRGAAVGMATTHLHRAIKHEDLERVEALLSDLENAVDVDAQEAGLGNSPLHLAAFIKNSQRSKAICQLLLDAGAQKGAADMFNQTPEVIARRRGNTEVAEFIASYEGQGNWFARQRMLHAVFSAFDLDGNGLIEEDELLEINQGLHPQGWNGDQNRAMMHQVDHNCDGRITRQELFSYYKKNLNKLSDNQFEAGVNKLLSAGLQARRLTNYQLQRVQQIFEAFDTDDLSLIHISEPTRLLSISYAVFCLKKKKKKKKKNI
eukprot:TRINITY_DN28675_c0_g1_i2.p1 TRINITY_DN28675_c0_g1~~TRINITY_DN28675_c0_g1_i2.p1  ORF type:complete len:288 (-),score=107.55 TRINITY_DN28675_c0_g1_i2:82-945(-)